MLKHFCKRFANVLCWLRFLPKADFRFILHVTSVKHLQNICKMKIGFWKKTLAMPLVARCTALSGGLL